MRGYGTAARDADRELRRRGLIPLGLGEDRFVQLEEIARFLDTHDPMEIGAGALLEASGYERSQLTLDQ